MSKCKHCGKNGLFMKTNRDGLCQNCAVNVELEEKERNLRGTIADLEVKLNTVQQKTTALTNDYDKKFNLLRNRAEEAAMASIKEELQTIKTEITGKSIELNTITAELETLKKDNEALHIKYIKEKNLYESFKSANKAYLKSGEDISEFTENISPSVEIPLNSLNVRQLKNLFTQNKKLINECLKRYEGRYTTKTNAALYKLMVVALEAELQNILYTLNYGKLDKALSAVREIIIKFLSIAIEGNQNIAPTMKKFIGEIEYLFIEAVKIEYEYYTQKERIKEEQRALREQMRQEAEERKALEQEKKQVEKEESKYLTEISNINDQIKNTEDEEKIKKLEMRLLELNSQLEAVEVKKEEITRLSTGKAGNVYIISNLGSFGDKVFKIGMTRRIDPMERVKELGDASVPFPFDVHSFIFSDDAVGLENNLHKTLNSQRVNRINLRKEFFNVSIEELEALVYKLQPSAEFNKTLLAEQYHQSLSVDNIPELLSDYSYDIYE